MIFIPIIALLLAAGVTWLARNRPSRTQWVVSTSFGVIVWFLSLLLFVAIPNAASFSVWQPASLFQTPFEFSLDKTSWGIAYCITTVLLSMILTAATRPDIASTAVRVFWFLYAALAMLAVFAINLLTVVLAFALIDLSSFIFYIYFTENVDDIRQAIIRAGIDLGGLLFIVAAAWVNSIDGHGVGLSATSFSAPAAFLFLVGILLRLGLIPLRFGRPSFSPLRRGVGTLLRLYPPALALLLLSRFIGNGAPEFIKVWLAVAGTIGILIGGIRWVLEEDRNSASPFLVMGLAGIGILTSIGASTNGDVLFATSALLLLVGGVLSLIQIHTPSHRVWPVFAAALLVGMPWSPGGLISSEMGQSALNEGMWIQMFVGIIGLSCLGLGAIHIYFLEEEPWPTGESLIRIMYSMGLALPVLVSIGLGLWMDDTFSIYGGLVSVTAVAVGVGAFFSLRNIGAVVNDRWRAVFLFLRFDPQRIYSVFWTTLRRFLTIARSIGDLFEGEAAMLWMFAFIALLLLTLR